MSASPAGSNPVISPGEMQLLLSRAGLILNPGQVADLVLAWRQVAGLIASISHDRPLADDMAVTFRLPPPADASAARATIHSVAVANARPKVKVKAKPKSRTSAKPKSRAKAKAKAKAASRLRTSPAPRKRARRGQ